jgi:Cu/Ag efflux protein CusF
MNLPQPRQPRLYALLATLLLTLAGTAQAQSNTSHDAHHPTPAASSATNGLPTAEAEVRRIDLQAGKVSLKHGDIPNLDMPPMTMVFQVKDASWLQQIKVGDKVRFTADKVNGAYTVMSLERMQ